MNKLTAAAIIRAAEANGDRILVVAKNQREAHEALLVLEQAAGIDAVTTRSVGRELIRYASGGEVRCISRRTAARCSVDTVFLDWEGARDDVEAYQEYMPNVVTSRIGEIVAR